MAVIFPGGYFLGEKILGGNFHRGELSQGAIFLIPCNIVPLSATVQMIRFFLSEFQKQPSRDVLKKRCSENMQQIYGGTHIPKRDFNTVAS